MLLVVQLIGVVAAAVVLAGAIGGRLDRRSLALGGALVPAAIACVLLGATLYPSARNLLGERARKAATPPQEVELVPGKSADVEVAFVEWARREVPPGSTFHVVSDDVDAFQWITFRLLPSIATTRDRADWLVIYDSDLDSSDAADFEAPKAFEEGFAVARRR